jgi:peptidoglycan/xylan/chitin deacetylase (PgdA/CDA1 family)
MPVGKRAAKKVSSSRMRKASIWPDGLRCAVILTFDYDAESDEMRTAPEKIVPISKARYGSTVGLERIYKVLEEFSLPATFFVPGWVAEKYEDDLKEIQSRGFEIAGHGYLHEKVSELKDEGEERRVFERCMQALRQRTKQNEIGYRAPWFDLNTRSLKILSELGFCYDSSLMQQDLPYFLLEEGEDGVTSESRPPMVELPVDWGLDDFPAFEVQRKSPQQVREIWRAEFDALYAEGSFYNLTMHPDCIGRPARIEMLRDFLKYLKSKPKVWFATAYEITKWWRESHVGEIATTKKSIAI